MPHIYIVKLLETCKVKKLLIFFLFFSGLSLPAFSLLLDDVDREVNIIQLDNSVSREDKLNKLNELFLYLNEEIERDPNNPDLFVKKAQVEYSKIFTYPIEKQLENEAALRKQIFSQVNAYAKKALELDNESHQLSESALLGLTKISSSKIIIVANQRYLMRASITPQQEIERIGQLSNHLIRENRFNEAIDIYQKLADKYPEQPYLKENIPYFEEKREEWEQSKDAESEAIKSQSFSRKLEAAKGSSLDKTSPASPKVNVRLKSDDKQALVDAQKSKDNLLWYLIAAIIAVLVIGGILLKRRS